MTLAQAILEFNHRTFPYVNVVRGALIRQIDAPAAENIAALIRTHLAPMQTVIPNPVEATCYFCAVIAQESGFDPQAVNMNLALVSGLVKLLLRLGYPAQKIVERTLNGIVSSADAGDPEPLMRADLGIAMFNVRYAPVPGALLYHAVVNQYLFSAEWSLEKMAQKYGALLKNAQALYPGEDPQRVSSGIYNGGPTGFKWAHAENQGTADALLARELATAKTYLQRQAIQKQYDIRKVTLVRITKHMDRVQEHVAWFRTRLDSTGEA